MKQQRSIFSDLEQCATRPTAILAALLASCDPATGTPDDATVDDAAQSPDAWISPDAAEAIDAPRLPPDAALGRSTVLRLDGDGDGVYLPRNPDYGLVGTRFTIELWFRPESPDVNDYAILYTRRGNYGEYGLNYSVADDGRVLFELYVDGATSRDGGLYLRSRAQVTTGVWHHAAGVVDGRAVRLYVDGVLEEEATAPADITWQPDDPRALLHDEYRTFIGYTRSPDDSGMRLVGRFLGDIDDVRVSRAARYAGPSFVPPVDAISDVDTVGLWTFEESGGPTAEDTSPTGALDGTILGAVRLPGGR